MAEGKPEVVRRSLYRASAPSELQGICSSPSSPPELAGVARTRNSSIKSRGLAAGWRGSPNMSGDDRDFIHQYAAQA